MFRIEGKMEGHQMAAAEVMPGGNSPHAVAGAGPAIVLRTVVKTYRLPAGDFTAIEGVDLEVWPGELVAIAGRSGSGKSTLLNLIGGIDQATAGSIRVAGTDLRGLGEDRLAAWRGRAVGLVFQFFQLLPTLTVAENVMLPMDFCNTFPPGERRRRALALLDGVGISDQANKLPASLSGGQQQRAAIARALANDPPILLADEPTGNLDSQNAEIVTRLFGGLAAAGKAIVIVTHESDAGRYSDRVVTLADGRVIAETRRPDAQGGRVATRA